MEAQRNPRGEQCPAIARSGERCKRFMNPGDDFCSLHDPRRSEERRRLASKAGKASSPYGENAGLRREAFEVLKEIREGKFPPDKAYAMTAVANLIINSLRLDLKIKEVEDFDRRLSEIEEDLAVGRL